MEDESYLTFWKTPHPLQFEMTKKDREREKKLKK